MIIYRKYFCAHIEAVLTIHSIPAAPAAATGLQYTGTSTMFLSARQACWNLSLMQHRKCPPPSQPRSSDRSYIDCPVSLIQLLHNHTQIGTVVFPISNHNIQMILRRITHLECMQLLLLYDLPQIIRQFCLCAHRQKSSSCRSLASCLRHPDDTHASATRTKIINCLPLRPLFNNFLITIPHDPPISSSAFYLKSLQMIKRFIYAGCANETILLKYMWIFSALCVKPQI